MWLPMDLVCPSVARWVPETSKSQPCPQGLPVCWRRARGWERLMSLTVFWACYQEVPGVLSGDNRKPEGGWLGDGGPRAGVLERGVLGQQDLGEELSSLLEKSG